MALSKILNASVTDSTLTTTKLATPNLGRRNLIINGAMSVAQRSTSSTSDSYSTIDRYLNETNGGTTTFSQENVASSDAPFAKGHRKFHRMTNTTANTATSALRRFAQRIEAQNVACSGWNYTSTDVGLTISFWARSSIAGTYYCWLYADDSASSAIAYVPTGFALLANTWTYVTQKIKGNSNLAFNNDNGSGLRIYIIAHQGTDMTSGSGTYDVWSAYSGTFRSGPMTQNWSHTAGSTFDITGLQAESSDEATPFEHRSFGEELSLCNRYYQEFNYDRHGYNLTNGHAVNNSQSIYTYTYYGGEMRATASVSTPSVSNGYRFLLFNYDHSHSTIPNIDNPSRLSVQFGNNQNTIVGGHGARLFLNASGAKVKFDAEL